MSQYPQPPIPPHQAPPPPYAYGMPQQMPQSSNGLAIAAMVCGIVAIILPPIGIIAIILGIIALVKTRRPGVGGKGMAIAGIVTGAIGIVLLPAILLPSLNRAREQANRIKCSANMRQISMGLIMYQSADSKRAYPPDFPTLAQVVDISPEIFVCPASNEVRATSVQQIQPGSQYCSYVYNYPRLTARESAPSDFVFLYQELDGHDDAGSNFGFADGRVEWFEKAKAQKLISEIKAGQNPPGSLYKITR